MLFTKPKKAIGVDVGTHSVKAVLMSRHGSRLRVEQVGYGVVDRAQYNLDPVAAQAEALSVSVSAMPVAKSLLVGALPGQTVVIRYPRFSDMPNDQLGVAVQREAGQNIPYDLGEVFLDWNLLDTYREGEQTMLKVLLVAAKHEVIDTRVQIADAAGLQFGVLSVDSLALADAAESCAMLSPDETVALINLGSSSTSIHFTRDGVSNFIRDVSWGARELINTLSKARRIDFNEAEKQLMNAANESGRVEDIVLLAPEPEPEPAPPPPAPPSSLGGLLDPLEDELGSLGDLGSPAPAKPSAPAPSSSFQGQSDKSLDEILEPALARLVGEVRRSFDFYEQQLYERPVDRIILSGGVAHLPVVQRYMVEELGIDSITTADPGSGAVTFANDSSIEELRRHPAQFMVAVGLAARGMSEL